MVSCSLGFLQSFFLLKKSQSSVPVFKDARHLLVFNWVIRIKILYIIFVAKPTCFICFNYSPSPASALENSRRNGIICFLFQRHLVEKFRTTSWNSITRVVCFISPFLVSVEWTVELWTCG
jgi:hypothetical protein